MGFPQVSVIVPVLNTRPYLAECFDSLVGQTLENMEIICVDNGSSDGSLDVLRTYAAAHGNITVLEHPFGRQGGARNAGISVARGEYIGFVDSDDLVAPNMFDSLYRAAEQGAAEVAICNIGFWYGAEKEVRVAVPHEQLQSPEPFSISCRPKLLRNLTICNKLFSSELVRRGGLEFPEGLYHEDQFFVTMALFLARSIVTSPDVMYFYRKQREGSVSMYRGMDHLHVFRVMEMLSDALHTRGLEDNYSDLTEELRICRYLAVFAATKGSCRHEFYKRMRSEFNDMELPVKPCLLTPTECREFRFVRRCSLSGFLMFLALRAIYARLRRYSQ